VIADFFQPLSPKKSVAGSPLITIAAAPFYRCSICCRETSVGGEPQSLCLLTQCLWPKFYNLNLRLSGWRIWKRENRSTQPSLLRFCISQRKNLMASIAPVIILALASGITAVWIGVLGFGVVRLVEYAMALL
jgi:hypothetical protein